MSGRGVCDVCEGETIFVLVSGVTESWIVRGTIHVGKLQLKSRSSEVDFN